MESLGLGSCTVEPCLRALSVQNWRGIFYHALYFHPLFLPSRGLVLPKFLISIFFNTKAFNGLMAGEPSYTDNELMRKRGKDKCEDNMEIEDVHYVKTTL